MRNEREVLKKTDTENRQRDVEWIKMIISVDQQQQQKCARTQNNSSTASHKKKQDWNRTPLLHHPVNKWLEQNYENIVTNPQQNRFFFKYWIRKATNNHRDQIEKWVGEDIGTMIPMILNVKLWTKN